MCKRTQTDNKKSVQGRDCDSDVAVRSSIHLVAFHYTGTDLWCSFPKFVIFSEIRVKFSVFEMHEYLLPVEKGV